MEAKRTASIVRWVLLVCIAVMITSGCTGVQGTTRQGAAPEVAPEQADAILARGRAFGQSRVICNVHWQSDVIEGRVVGAGTVARLHASPEFRADVEAARVELAAIRGKGLKPTRDCQAEAAAMALEPPQAP